MREITGHQSNAVGQRIRLFAGEDLTAGGAPRHYDAEVQFVDQSRCVLHLDFHEGDPAKVGATGIVNELLLEVLINRLSCFQAGPFPCVENNEALACLQEAKVWLNRRTALREARGVEGQAIP